MNERFDKDGQYSVSISICAIITQFICVLFCGLKKIFPKWKNNVFVNLSWPALYLLNIVVVITLSTRYLLA